MSEKEKVKEKEDFEEGKKKIDNLVKVSLIIGIIVISGFIIFYSYNQEPGFVDFGLLNKDKMAENYPTEAKVNQSIIFYVYVGNFLGEDFTFRLKILKGDNDTEMSPDREAKNAELYERTKSRTLSDEEEWISNEFTISFSQVGSNQIIIVELWEIPEDGDEEYFNFLFLRINVTA